MADRLAFCRMPGKLVQVSLINVAMIVMSSVVAMFAQTTSTVQGTVRDPHGLPLPGVEVQVANSATGATWKSETSAEGVYRVTGLPAGIYHLTASAKSFATQSFPRLEVSLDRTLTLDFALAIGSVEQVMTVDASVPLLETSNATTGSLISPLEIEDTPLNGRNYLDLLQLVPGVAINNEADQGSDTATPILGDRAGNTMFLIDGMPNRDAFDAGPASQFNQDSIHEFEVLTSSFKAEFGQGSGGVVNVITKSGSNDWHGSGFLFHRNSALDANDSLQSNSTVPTLLRWDYGVTVGGPVVKDHVFFFASAERIWESRQLNFSFPPGTPSVLENSENSFDNPSRTFETRVFAKLDERVGHHALTEEVNFDNYHLTDYLPLSEATNFPSTRGDSDYATAVPGFRDVALLGNQSNPFLLNVYYQFRNEPSDSRPAHPSAGPLTGWQDFSSVGTGQLFGDLGQFNFGTGATPAGIDQTYHSLGAGVSKALRNHTLKFGADFTRTIVDGTEPQLVFNQLFATGANYAQYGPIFSGLFILTTTGGLTPQADEVHLRNNYVGPYVQDDWKIAPGLTLNLGVRWDYDSAFKALGNVSPRIGVAWQANPKTVVRGSFGVFYDHFRMGLAQRIPAFGGADFRNVEPVSYPQLFYNVTTTAPLIWNLCIDPYLTDAQIAGAGKQCAADPALPLYGVDHINNTIVAAAGGTPVPAATVVTQNNIQSLSGLSPTSFLAAVNNSVPLPTGLSWYWGPYGVLSQTFLSGDQPIQLTDFKTPFTRSYSIGVQRELSSNLVLTFDYIHKSIRNISGVRDIDLPFAARLPNQSVSNVTYGFGPWFDGRFDGLVLNITKRFSTRYTFGASYTYTDAVDDLLNPNLNGTNLFALPSDSFVGVPPVVTDPATGQTNANGSFVASNGNPVPKAGVFYNGPGLDRGKSDLALKHTVVLHGSVNLPWSAQISGIFRAQSGFPFSANTQNPVDVDGDNNFAVRDITVPRNTFRSPMYIDTDLRVSKQLYIREKLHMSVLIECFNLFNRQNPAAVQNLPGVQIPFGGVLQVLPGLETQVGLKISF